MKVSPISKIINKQVETGQVVFAEGKKFEFDLSESNLIILDREEFDKQLAAEAVKAGSEVKIGTRIEAYNESNDGVSLKTSRDEYKSDLLIDASGVVGYDNKEGLMPATQFVYAIKNGFYDGIMVFIDKRLLPDFFGWYIPLGDGLAKVGSSGDPNFALKFMEKNLGAVNISGYPIKAISSSLVIGGINKKANKRTLKVGDAGGQTKPTTGGGIVSGGLGGMLAGAESVKGTFADYNKSYDNLFGSELKRQLALASVYKKMSSGEILKIISEIHEISSKLTGREFDFHSHLVRRLALNPAMLKIIIEYIPDMLRELV
ncbi:MAG: NAD(P)/FAD-dependent oxidoreductase [Nitrososphaeria archaeon]